MWVILNIQHVVRAGELIDDFEDLRLHILRLDFLV